MVARTTKGTAVVSLPADTDIVITREFDAPAHLVYRAWTSPELIKRWWTADRGEAKTVEVDLRVGGRWRCVMVANGGFEVAGKRRSTTSRRSRRHWAERSAVLRSTHSSLPSGSWSTTNPVPSPLRRSS